MADRKGSDLRAAAIGRTYSPAGFMSFPFGTRLGPYEIIAPLARAAWARSTASDAKQHRDIALKVLEQAELVRLWRPATRAGQAGRGSTTGAPLAVKAEACGRATTAAKSPQTAANDNHAPGTARFPVT